jgi:hypothetical protein
MKSKVSRVPVGRFAQQGDVLFKRVHGLPEGLKAAELKNGAYVLAEGEATGHSHTVLPDGAKLFEDSTKTLWLSVEKPSTIRHQEHGPITLAPGAYKVGQVVEVDPFTNEIHAVRD